MTYAKKLTADIMQAQLLEDVPIEEAIEKGIEIAMQAQRKACTDKGMSVYEEIDTTRDITLYKQLKQAILNAEVNV